MLPVELYSYKIASNINESLSILMLNKYHLFYSKLDIASEVVPTPINGVIFGSAMTLKLKTSACESVDELTAATVMIEVAALEKLNANDIVSALLALSMS
jgi:hypothetical protein